MAQFFHRRSGTTSSRSRFAKSTRRLSAEMLDDRLMLTVNVELLVDINFGEDSSLFEFPEGIPTNWIAFDGMLYFAADDGIHGTELWKSDGTEEGTALVADVNEAIPLDPFATADTEGSFPVSLTVFNDELYFTAASDVGDELWKTDGSEAGTVLVADINAGPEDSFPFSMAVYRDELYFGALGSEDEGYELWKTDGTESGTQLVADVNPGEESSFPTYLYAFEDELYFSAAGTGQDVELWKTDGTAEGTELVSDINPGEDVPSFPESYFEFNDELYFIAADTVTADGVISSHLYKTDGTDAGTVRVADERLTIRFTDELPNVTEYKNHLYFGGINDIGAWELYRTDGTPGQSELVLDLSGAFSSSPTDLIEFRGQLYFAANDDTGRQLWRTNGELGEANEAVRLTSIENGTVGAFPTEFTEYNNELFFNAHDGVTFQVWRLGNDAPETLTSFEPNDNSFETSKFIEAADTLFFRGAGVEGLEMWTATLDEVAPLTGDVDGNGKVEFADFLVLSQNFGQDVSSREEGDLDGNGTVEFADFLLLSQNFGAQVEALFAMQG